MVADMDILVNKILHKSFIEQGTEATAATAALLICCSAKPIPDKIDFVPLSDQGRSDWNSSVHWACPKPHCRRRSHLS